MLLLRSFSTIGGVKERETEEQTTHGTLMERPERIAFDMSPPMLFFFFFFLSFLLDCCRNHDDDESFPRRKKKDRRKERKIPLKK